MVKNVDLVPCFDVARAAENIKGPVNNNDTIFLSDRIKVLIAHACNLSGSVLLCGNCKLSSGELG